MNYRFKIWLEKDDEQVLGDGLVYQLTLIRKYGSISRAAEDMQMSYRHAWGTIKKAEGRLGVSLLIKKVGGESGGGAQLTPEAENLLDKYEAFRREAGEAVEKSFVKHFGP